MLADNGLPRLSKVAGLAQRPQQLVGRRTACSGTLREHVIYTGGRGADRADHRAAARDCSSGTPGAACRRGRPGQRPARRAGARAGGAADRLGLSPKIHYHARSPGWSPRRALPYIIPVEIVLVILAIPPILTNTYAGVQNVDPAARDAAGAWA